MHYFFIQHFSELEHRRPHMYLQFHMLCIFIYYYLMIICILNEIKGKIMLYRYGLEDIKKKIT